ncbi:hypothetical protein RI129_008584 [Pyrocoelia pectoralis]|uniref:CHK kinase-like domain-containing protein n=1 Tax=Pyrocoelia pectoralis TaxID=417401 RepID=A0AAN7V7L3_9COLE
MEEGMEALVMDDMSVKGFKVGSGIVLDYSHALLAIRELGKFHALSYAIRDQKPELLKEWISKSADSFYNSTLKNIGMKAIMDVGRVVLESYESSENRTESEVLESFLSRLPQFFELPSIGKADKYSVINHGDFQMRNMLFKYGDSSQPHHPTALCMIDWQLSRLASPALDILFFLSVCSDKNLREHHYDNLIQEYHKSFSSFLKQLGSDPNVLLPFEVLLHHLKEYGGFGLCNAMWLIPMAAQECDFSKCTNEDALLKEFPTSPQQQYVPIIRDIITDFIKYGYQL